MESKDRNYSITLVRLGAALILLLLAIGTIDILVNAGSYAIFDPAQITVWAWVRDVYHLASWLACTICPGIILTILALAVFNWATKDKTNGKD